MPKEATRREGHGPRAGPPPKKAQYAPDSKTKGTLRITIASGDTAEEIGKLRQGGDGHIMVSGGISFWRSLMQLDLVDEFRVTLLPYLAGDGTRLFEDVGQSRQLDQVSSIAWSNGTIELEYRRHR